jgi:hypothetical protein
MNEMVDEMVVMMKMRWNKERKENMRCQVTLIFTSGFLHETANQRLVFRLIHLFIYLFIFFFKNQRLG